MRLLALARQLLHEALRRERRLTLLALALWLFMLPALVALCVDDHQLRGVNIWLKPLKFMASVGVFAITTAWFIGLLPEARRRAWPVQAVVWTILLIGPVEVGYIALQAALGQASHYNFSDRLHVALYSVMGLGALSLTATQVVLAWQIARQGRRDVSVLWRSAVVAGLLMTFVLGAGTGGFLGSMQPPGGAGLPVVGWHLFADLRPAHFVGMHAQQIVPFVGWCLLPWPAARGRVAFALFCAGYVALWLGLMALGLHGAQLTLPPLGGR